MTGQFTLTGFLEGTGAHLSFYDVGRRVRDIARDDFLAFEQAALPYPQPLQGKAWFALVQQREPGTEPIVWFLRLDLDEQGKLLQATRDYLIHRFVDIATTGEQADPGAALRDNPYVFRPRDDRMAVFHARLTRDLGLPPSRHYAHALAYFRGEPGWDQWNFIGYQGIADVALRADRTDGAIGEVLCSALPELPQEPLVALLHCLENVPLPPRLGRAILERSAALDRDDGVVLPAAVRALAQAADPAQRARILQRALAEPAQVSVETLAALGGRAWEGLRDAAIAGRYLQALVESPEEDGVFAACLADVLAVPGMRAPLLAVLHRPDLPQAVRDAFERMQADVAAQRGASR